ncbi:MAG: SagB/ThcOx family dehydrogenase [Tannerella sp.]|jgi:SagB-type dehydrogenase family enzyme|nr:SagB/ThcOx family dehydrogenase [Tannerella sp.]
MKKIILSFSILAIVFAGCTDNQVYTPEKTTPMELTKFENIKLLAPNIESGAPLMKCMQERKSYREFAPENLSLKHLSEILWVANGINRPEENRRTVPAASAIYPLDTYVFLANGVYLYNPQEHVLETVVEGDHRALAGLKPFVETAPLNILLIADFDKFRQSGMPIPAEMYMTLAGADAGHCTQNVYLYCASEGLKSVVRGGVKEKELLELLHLGESHHVALAQTVGY